MVGSENGGHDEPAMTTRDAEVFCNLLAQQEPIEITRFAAWMAEQIAESKAKGASA